MIKVVRFLMQYSRGATLFAIALGLLGGACGSGIVAVITSSIGEVDPERLHRSMKQFVVLALLLPVSAVGTQYLLGRTNQLAVLRLQKEVARKILTLPLKRLEEIGASDLLHFITRDINSVSASITQMSALLINVTFVAGLLVYLVWLSWKGFLLIIGLIGLVAVTQRIPAKAAQAELRKARNESSRLFQRYRGLIFGNKELKSHSGRGRAFVALLDSVAEAMATSTIRAVTLMMAAASWYRFLILALIGSLLFFAPDFIQFDSEKMTIFILILFMVGSLVQQTNERAVALANAGISLDKLGELGFSVSKGAKLSTLLLPEAPTSPLPWEQIELRGVVHTYRREDQSGFETFALGPIDLSFRRGELIILAGGNGSGKTTLAKLLVGLYEPESGSVYLNGKEIDSEAREAYRQIFSVVYSDFFLFESLLGLEDLSSDERGQAYLKKLQLDHKLEIKNGSFSTTDLSQGQRKRLALLTSYMEDRSFYVFDEWAADQDPVFKRFFYEELLPELKSKGKTVLAISHDNHYYQVADRVIYLDYGKVDREERQQPSSVRPAAHREMV